jgi:hypothetical protein
MIQLHPDYLIFRTSHGELIPCSAESVTIELIGDVSSTLDPDTVREAAAAVVHYFREELGQETVSVSEFSSALERALRMFGFDVVTTSSEQKPAPSGIDLGEIARAGNNFELAFFKCLREEFDRQPSDAQEVIQFVGLRDCVKSLIGAKRWCQRCEALSDQIVQFMRECLTVRNLSRGLLVR